MTITHRTSVPDLAAWRRAGAVATSETISDLMTWPAVAVRPGVSSATALRLMEDAEMHHLLVTLDNELVGILCACDLAAAPSDAPVATAMTRSLVAVDPDATLADAEALMADEHVACLPCFWLGAWGVVTRGDLVRRGVGARPRCEACGNHHHVRRGPSGGLLCKSCEEGTPRTSLDAIYVDLGVSG